MAVAKNSDEQISCTFPVLGINRLAFRDERLRAKTMPVKSNSKSLDLIGLLEGPHVNAMNSVNARRYFFRLDR